MSTFWFRPTVPSTWHVVCSWPDGRRRVLAVRRSRREATAHMQRAVGQVLGLDRQGNLEPRATARGIAVCDDRMVRAALTVEPCELEQCTACAVTAGGAR